MTMKAHTEQQQFPGRCLGEVRHGRKDLNHEEMQSLLAKLKDLVPNMPRNKKLSKLEIIQNVIDYILDLQIALETHPATRSALPAGSSSTSPARQPLGLLSPSSNAVANTCLAQEVTDADWVPTNIAEPMSMVVPSPHPVSCRTCETDAW